MAKPTLCVSEIGKKKANDAFHRSGKTQEFIAGKAGTTRQTVGNFLNGVNVDRQIFIAICEAFELDWRQIVGIEDNQPKDIEELVKLVRGRCEADIRKRCGTMRVLDMEQPIALNEIYTDVNILKRLTRNQRRDLEESTEKCNVDDFYRWGLGGIQQARVEGIEAVKQHNKLLILGKPGAGKTTFLKFLATACIDGKLLFAEDHIPIFVTLKDFAETEKDLCLLRFISRQTEQYGIEETTPINRNWLDLVFHPNANALEFLLRKGKMLVLLDGLDEVREKDDERVLREIKKFAQNYSQSQIIVTCRIAAKQYIFEQFTEVEIADFDDQQISTFAKNWFQFKQVNAKDFLDELQKYRGIKDIATSPLLLTLLCLAFEESGSFPANRAELYKEGLDALLRKWDSKRGIRRDSVYKDLSVQKKEDMLSQIALTTFEKENYFVKQRQLEDHICDYIRNTANAKTDAQELHLNSEAVLKSIESQHGLFVERARGIYSFSHLTFHEYFAARQIVLSTSPNKLETALKNLVTHITDKRWREVILLSVGMAREADDLLLLMKLKIDNLLAGEEKLQSFLAWLDKKSRSVNSPYKLAAFRAYYFDIGFALILPLDRNLALPLDSKLAFDLDTNFALDSDLNLDCNLVHALSLTLALDRGIDHELDIDRTIERFLTEEFAIDHSLHRELDITRTIDQIIDRDRSFAIECALNHAKESGIYELCQRLQDLKERLNQNPTVAKTNRNKWNQDFRQLIIDHRNIGYDWQFTEKQKEKLKQYYDTNSLLVECLNSDCYVSRETRQEIEESLLLPSKKLS